MTVVFRCCLPCTDSCSAKVSRSNFSASSSSPRSSISSARKLLLESVWKCSLPSTFSLRVTTRTNFSRSEHYVTLKIGIQDNSNTSPIRNEIETLQHLAKSPREHPGSNYARLAKDIFEIEGPRGKHSCVVSTPQGCSLWALQSMFPEGKVPAEVVSYVVQRLLGCVNWLFCDCDIVHTGMCVASSYPSRYSLCHRNHCSECPFGNER